MIRLVSFLWLFCTVSLANAFGLDGNQEPFAKLVYVGDVYQRLIVLEKNDMVLLDEKLVKYQNVNLPLRVQGKKVKRYIVRVNQRELLVKLGCKKKQIRKALASDIIQFQVEGIKPLCVIKDTLIADEDKPKVDRHARKDDEKNTINRKNTAN